MVRRPLIGLPAQTMESKAGRTAQRWSIGRRYVTALASLGAAPIILPLVDNRDVLHTLYETLDGILLPGGGDPDPALYDQETQPFCGRIEPDRDRVELQLVEWATRDNKPLLGICRGIQVINVAYGGTLYQDLAAQKPDAVKHDYFPARDGHPRDLLAHQVTIEPGTRLSRILGMSSIKVNSIHHQAIDRLGEGLRATAWAPDGVVEAVEHVKNDHYLVAVQWHPEELVTNLPHMRHLFSDFVDASAGFKRDASRGKGDSEAL